MFYGIGPRPGQTHSCWAYIGVLGRVTRCFREGGERQTDTKKHTRRVRERRGQREKETNYGRVTDRDKNRNRERERKKK